MAQPLIKFFRVAKIADLQATQKVQGGLYFETETGILYVYNGTAFEAYSGLKSASFADQKLVLTPSVGAAIEIDLSGYVDSSEFNTELANYVKKEQTIADITLQDNITAEELQTALGLGTAAYKAVEDFAPATALEDANKYTDDAKAAVIGDATEAGNTLGKLEDRIETIVANEKTYSIAKVESGLGENVKEAYKLVDEDGTQVGETINIYKDSSLISVDLVDEKPAETEGAEATKGQFIKYTYVLATGVESVQYVDVSRLLVEAEFKDGLEVSAAGEVSVKVDAASEAFLSVSEAGVKLSGVQEAINAAVAAKNVTASGDTYVSASVTKGTNHVTVAASETTKASLALANTALQAADITTGTNNGSIAVDGTDVYVKGLGDAAYVGLTATPTENSNDAFTAGGAYLLDEKIDANTTAIGALSDRIDGLDFGVTSVTASTSSAHVTVTPTTASDGAVTVTVDVASVDAANGGAAGLATDAYVQEQIAASALTWQLF